MRSLRFVLAFALMSLSTAAFAQSDMHKSDAVQNSDAQKSFDQLKTLAGTWRGSVKATPPDPEIDNAKLEITLRVTSRGNALVHEMQEAGTPLDATKHDHQVTMLYLDGSKLNLIHYCDAGNRPHMVAIVDQIQLDRKSTRLNSSHVAISYAVFCLKKKNI